MKNTQHANALQYNMDDTDFAKCNICGKKFQGHKGCKNTPSRPRTATHLLYQHIAVSHFTKDTKTNKMISQLWKSKTLSKGTKRFIEERIRAKPKYRVPMSEGELESFIDGVYSGILIANQKLKEYKDDFGNNLRIKVPPRSKMMKMLRHK